MYKLHLALFSSCGITLSSWAYLQVLLSIALIGFPGSVLFGKKKSVAERSKTIISSFDRKYKVSVQESLKLSRDPQEKIGVSISAFCTFH